MGFLSKILKRNQPDEPRTGGMEDFMTLIRVYYQAAMAQKIGITNLSVLPDLRVFKQTLHVTTVSNRLGLGERNRCRKMLMEIYGMSDNFFKEIDGSLKRGCHNIQEVQPFLYMFQGFSQNFITMITTTLQWKLRLPSIFKKTLYAVIQKGVNDILTKDNWKDDAKRKTAYGIRVYQRRLGYTPEWMAEYAYHIILLAKKEPRNKNKEEDDKK